MIIYSNLGKKGNLGNQLFQIASTLSIAKQSNQDYGFPEWQYYNSFINKLPSVPIKKEFNIIREVGFDYNELILPNGDYNLNGWFQSEKYFDRDNVKKQFEFKPELIESVKVKYKNELSKKHILISVRRGDFVNNPYYFQLDYKYYFLAITTQFSDWEERNLIFTSDDINYCKKHFSFLANAMFVEKTTAIEQLVLGSLCNDFVISNSTFSWWLAWLGEKEDSKIIRPIQNFRGKFRIENDDKDYFPDRWVSFNPKRFKINPKFYVLVIKAEFLKLIALFNFKINSFVIHGKKSIKKTLKKF
ncbi:alpha-1,2-fucosyltransferase [Olleya sp. 1-3]|uniref:alpha-1,2-fucosyltransferase n=1 Tax=Olleya sp. 1-3 TaxID=2058323 RepID=UPI0012FF3BEC|nr:alpha-1,2-fucosyltransferase [Olleya sp. 1-3]